MARFHDALRNDVCARIRNFWLVILLLVPHCYFPERSYALQGVLCLDSAALSLSLVMAGLLLGSAGGVRVPKGCECSSDFLAISLDSFDVQVRSGFFLDTGYIFQLLFCSEA